MRRLLFLTVMVIQAALAFGQEQTPAPEVEAQQHLYEALNGRNVQGHLYPDPWTDPERHTAVSIPVIDGILQLGALKSTYPAMAKSALVLIRGDDQTHKEVAKALDRFILVFGCEPDPREPTLIDRLDGYDDFAPWWTFVDALGQPMMGASIEARTYFGAVAHKATLDDKGQAPRRIGTPFTFKVEHPNYGVVTVEHTYTTESLSGLFVLPLIARDSWEFPLAAQGEVIDSAGKPVRNAMVYCTRLVGPDGNDLYTYSPESHIITDAYRRFAIALPIVTEEFQWQGPPPAGARYDLQIEPPLESNLRQASVEARAGTKQTFILTPMDAQEYFHTFSFEYAEGPVTSEDELRNIELTLVRDGRPRQRLKYEQWKNGIALPQGELQASTMRWGEYFRFTDIVLTAESPTDIVVKSSEPMTFRGRVVDGLTGKPVANVLVHTYRTYSPEDSQFQAGDPLQQLRDWAVREAAGGSPQLLYQSHNRATTTDADGVFQFTFVPGITSYMHEFYATAPDGRTGRMERFPMFPHPDRIIDAGTIKLLRHEDRTHQFPTMIFHDEQGPVTDPNRLKAIEIDVRKPGWEMAGARPYDNLVEEREFIAGLYCARVEWDRKLYTFEPVEVNSPSGVFTFRPQRIDKADVVYEGRIIHAITGQPVANAIILRGEGTPEYDPASLTSDQWAAIRAMGPRIDPAHPAVAPLKCIFERPGDHGWHKIDRMTQTDSDGRFSLPVKRSLESAWNSLVVFAPDFLGLEQSLDYTVFPENRSFEWREDRQIEADANGVAHVPPVKLIPAAKVLIHPVVSDPGHGYEMQDIQFSWTSPPGAKPPWTDDFTTRQSETPNFSLFYTSSLQPNATQSLYVPAEASVALTMYSHELSLPPAHLGTVTLKQGEVLDLGRVKFPPGVRVAAKILDSRGNPVRGIRVDCTFETGFQRMIAYSTDASGCVTLSLPAHSSGTFRAINWNAQTPVPAQVSVPFRIAGPEDAGKEFVLRFPDDLKRQFIESPEETPPAASPASQ